jgi:hypothetical protein
MGSSLRAGLTALAGGASGGGALADSALGGGAFSDGAFSDAPPTGVLAGVVAAVVQLVDMPGITAEAVRRLSALAEPGALAMAGYGERRGHPVLLGRDHWAAIARLALGDVGARPYLAAHAALVRVVPCADIADDTDMDLPPVTGSAAGP